MNSAIRIDLVYFLLAPQNIVEDLILEQSIDTDQCRLG
jgi:hypothetical protein